MADKKESALSTGTDAAYVRAIDVNGNSIQISKKDLANVIMSTLEINVPKTALMESGEEYNTGYSYRGLMTLYHHGSGKIAVLTPPAQAMTNNDILVDNIGISVSLDTVDKICINRKETNGYIFIKNNTSTQQIVLISSI